VLTGRLGANPFDDAFGEYKGVCTGTGLAFGHGIGGITTLVVACAEADSQAANGEKKEFFEHNKKGFLRERKTKRKVCNPQAFG
jgi:hypothetical protein